MHRLSYKEVYQNSINSIIQLIIITAFLQIINKDNLTDASRILAENIFLEKKAIFISIAMASIVLAFLPEYFVQNLLSSLSLLKIMNLVRLHLS